jgi:hypothetical protein
MDETLSAKVEQRNPGSVVICRMRGWGSNKMCVLCVQHPVGTMDIQQIETTILALYEMRVICSRPIDFGDY